MGLALQDCSIKWKDDISSGESKIGAEMCVKGNADAGLLADLTSPGLPAPGARPDEPTIPMDRDALPNGSHVSLQFDDKSINVFHDRWERFCGFFLKILKRDFGLMLLGKIVEELLSFNLDRNERINKFPIRSQIPRCQHSRIFITRRLNYL